MPMKILLQSFLIVTVLFSAVLLSCSREKHVFLEEYLIKIDSISMPDSVNLQSRFDVAFYGIIGSDGCSRFLRFEHKRVANGYEVYVIGERKTGHALVCPEYLPILNGEKLNLLADSLGYIQIKVINPGVANHIIENIVVKQ